MDKLKNLERQKVAIESLLKDDPNDGKLIKWKYDIDERIVALKTGQNKSSTNTKTKRQNKPGQKESKSPTGPTGEYEIWDIDAELQKSGVYTYEYDNDSDNFDLGSDEELSTVDNSKRKDAGKSSQMKNADASPSPLTKNANSRQSPPTKNLGPYQSKYKASDTNKSSENTVFEEVHDVGNYSYSMSTFVDITALNLVKMNLTNKSEHLEDLNLKTEDMKNDAKNYRNSAEEVKAKMKKKDKVFGWPF